MNRLEKTEFSVIIHVLENEVAFMQRYLKRNVYNKFLIWKRNPDHKTLEVSGARQVGKTYIVNKFANEQYTHKIYVSLSDFSGEIFMEHYNDLKARMKAGERIENPVYELIRLYEPTFEDNEDTVVIVDEIQESSDIYNRIREFTRNLKSDFIITGSYLGRILDKKFRFSSGDIDSIEVNTLDFQEFLQAVGKHELFENLDIFGSSDPVVYEELYDLYQSYCNIGGYPSVILKYLENKSVQDCQAELIGIIRLFTNESKRYFQDILDDETYDNIFCSIARTLAKEKKGFEKDSFSEDLQRIVVKDYSSKIGKATINRAIDWLYSSGIIGFAGKISDCNILDFQAKSRCFFMDIGLCTYFLTKIGYRKEQRSGVISENFVYLDLKHRLHHPAEIALETPAFATYQGAEMDFFVQSITSEKTYVIEVKSGKNNNKTIRTLQERNIVDYILYAKGNTKGGIKDNIYTIPIYSIAKFSFN